MADDDFDLVTTKDQYEALTDRLSYDILVVQFGGPFMHHMLNDQANNNKNLRWVHALTAGIDAYTPAIDFIKSDIPLTNVRGAFSAVLGEFIALGMLFHAKQMPKFLQHQSNNHWQAETVELVSNKTMAIVGYGDIGAACGKVIKPFGTKVIGVKRRPDVCTDEQKQNADEIVGMDQLDAVVAKSDFVVGILPKTDHTLHFFNTSFF